VLEAVAEEVQEAPRLALTKHNTVVVAVAVVLDGLKLFRHQP